MIENFHPLLQPDRVSSYFMYPRVPELPHFKKDSKEVIGFNSSNNNCKEIGYFNLYG